MVRLWSLEAQVHGAAPSLGGLCFMQKKATSGYLQRYPLSDAGIRTRRPLMVWWLWLWWWWCWRWWWCWWWQLLVTRPARVRVVGTQCLPNRGAWPAFCWTRLTRQPTRTTLRKRRTKKMYPESLESQILYIWRNWPILLSAQATYPTSVRLFEAHLTWNSRSATSPWKKHEKLPYGPYGSLWIHGYRSHPLFSGTNQNWNGRGPRQWPYGTDIPSHPAVFGMCTNKGPWRSSLAPNLTSFHRENDGKMIRKWSEKWWENGGKMMGIILLENGKMVAKWCENYGKWLENDGKMVGKWYEHCG